MASTPNEHVLVLDYNPTAAKAPTVQSMSKDLTVSGLKIEEAPGAAVDEENNPKNDRMYIIDTTVSDGTGDIAYGDRNSAHNILTQFKRRNMVLRRALQYPDTPEQPSTLSQPWSHPTSPLRS